ncbi:MAG: hypothetical protein JF616_21400 [Fibrobacteres bacterium]|nr:hypothetical protein [Fibrobacterota bacterium]
MRRVLASFLRALCGTGADRRSAGPIARLITILPGILLSVLPARAVQIGDLPGEDISSGEVSKAEARAHVETPVRHNNNWLAASIEEQLARERTLIPMGKGAIFVPSYTEPRREPEVTVTTLGGMQVKNGTTGQRILVDSGLYTVRLGSGTAAQQMSVDVRVEEGHTSVVPPEWSGLLVETLTPEGNYLESQYEVIRVDRGTNYGKGRGLPEERLQDIRAWLLPAGMYRISKPGEGFNSLRNYITVQLNPGELTQIELIFDKTSGDLIAGGVKALNTRVKMGSNWSLGIRAGGNVDLSRVTDNTDTRKEAALVSDDLRMRLQYDDALYLGTTELFLQDNFSKERNRRLNVTSDIAELRTTWIRRLLPWLGPYVRTILSTHLFDNKPVTDSVSIVTQKDSSGTLVPQVSKIVGGNFIIQPSLDPLNLQEGAGFNVEMVSKYYLEANSQLGVAAIQNLVDYSYVTNGEGQYLRAKSTYEIGVEGNLYGTLRLGSDMTLDLRLELFAPNSDPARIRLRDLTADFRFFLTRNIEIGYLYQVKEETAITKNRFPSSHNLSLRLSFNY